MPQYKIKSGDTLSQIAKSKGFTLNQLKQANPQITDLNKIRAGATLKLPYAASKAVAKEEQAQQLQEALNKVLQRYDENSNGSFTA